MAKPATQLTSIVLESVLEPHTQRGARSARSSESDALTCRAEDVELTPDAREDLLTAIEQQVIPRLLQAHGAPPRLAAIATRPRQAPTRNEVAELADLAAEQNLFGALALAERILYEGLTLEAVLIELIAAAARQLGEAWEQDLRSFTDVTLGLGTLHELVHLLGPRDEPVPGTSESRGSVLLVSRDVEQHTLGLHIFGELLRRANWLVLVEPSMSAAELLQHVESQRLEMIGISVSCSDQLAPLARLVRDVRRASLNTTIAVMLGGPMDLTEYAAELGATFCSDARSGVRWLDAHVSVPRSNSKVDP